MKILHTSDWHIGKLVHGLHMTHDQRYMLKQMVQLIKEENIDLVIVAGDIYDRSIPPTEAVELLDEILSEIVMDLKVKVIIIAGNHDSPDRLNFGSKILRDHGLYIYGHLIKDQEPLVLSDAYGCVHFHPIPYADPLVVRALYEEPSIKSHDQAMEAIVKALKPRLKPQERHVAIGHAFVMGTDTLEVSDSERPLSIGGSSYVNVDHFEDFDYVALGHLHRPQKVKFDHVRYGGSLLKYSFSEARQKKSFTLIDMKEKGQVLIQQKSLVPQHDLRVLTGSLEDLMMLRPSDDYISASLTDQGKLFEPMKKLRHLYPNILQLEKQRLVSDAQKQVLTGQDLKHKSLDRLFEDFYTYVSGQELSPQVMESFGRIYRVLQKEERDK